MWTQHVVHSQDPMCGMHLDTDEIAATYVYIGRIYTFCSIECHDLFVRSPEQYMLLLAHDPQGHCGFPCSLQRGR
jgi:YHS domain-containing protein